MAYFTQGDTAGYTVAITDEDDVQIDLNEVDDIRCTLKQDGVAKISKFASKDELTINEDGTYTVIFSQEETFRFQPGTAKLQTFLKKDDATWVSYGTDKISVLENIAEEVI